MLSAFCKVLPCPVPLLQFSTFKPWGGLLLSPRQGRNSPPAFIWGTRPIDQHVETQFAQDQAELGFVPKLTVGCF